MKVIKLVCPKCDTLFYYNNFWTWVLHAPCHWFGKRKTKCPSCEKWSWIKRSK